MLAPAAWGGAAAGAGAGGVLADALPLGGAPAPDGAPKFDATAAPARPATAAAAVAALGGDGGGLADDERVLPVDAVDPVVAEEFAGVAVAGRCLGVAPSAVPVARAALGGEVLGAVDVPAGGDAGADGGRGGALAGLGGDAVLALLLVVAEEFVGVVVAGRCFGATPSAVVVGRAEVLGAVEAPAGGDEGADVADMLLGAPAGPGGGAALVLSLVVAVEAFAGVVVVDRCCGAAPTAAVVARAAPGGVLGDGDAPAGDDEGTDPSDTLLGAPAGGDEVCSDDGGAGVGDAASATREEAGPGSTIGRVTVRRCTSFRSLSSAAANFSTVSSFGSGSGCWNMYVMCCRLQPDRAASSTFDIFFASRR